MVKNYRVFNKCKYDIGLKLASGQEVNIGPGSFRLLTSDDVLFVESVCSNIKFFSQRLLVAVDPQTNKEVSLEEIGGFTDDTNPPHMNDDEIVAQLKQSGKKLETWIASIEDPAELHGIYEVAKTLDLPASKLKLLSSYMPDKDFLAE